MAVVGRQKLLKRIFQRDRHLTERPCPRGKRFNHKTEENVLHRNLFFVYSHNCFLVNRALSASASDMTSKSETDLDWKFGVAIEIRWNIRRSNMKLSENQLFWFLFVHYVYLSTLKEIASALKSRANKNVNIHTLNRRATKTMMKTTVTTMNYLIQIDMFIYAL